MDIIEEARNAMTTSQVVYHEFALDFKPGVKAIYCFYEGDSDEHYYGVRIDLRCPHLKRYDYRCHGKDNLLEFYKRVQEIEAYRLGPLAFFADRDFDAESTASNKNFYTTPFYSIENFYTVESAVKKVLSKEFGISNRSNLFGECITKFQSLQKEFHDKMLVCNSWLACQADLRKEEGKNTRLKIDKTIKWNWKELIPEDMTVVNVSDNLQTQESLEELFGDETPKIPIEKFKNKLAKFRNCKKEETFRGKFELQFLVSFLTRLQGQLSRPQGSIFSKRQVCNLRFEYATSLSMLTDSAITPKSLLKYLSDISGPN